MDDKRNSPSFVLAEKRFRSELSEKLGHPEKLGKWLLYSPDGCVEESADEDSLYKKYGNKIGSTYFLGRVQPKPPAAEVTSNWFVDFEKTPKGQSGKGRKPGL